MQLSDLKRAVEDVLLQPEVNCVGQLEGRASIAALDLCQASTSSSTGASSSSDCPSVATRTCSSSSETVAARTGCGPPSLATSTSLDHIVLRGPVRSGGISRRSSRILPHHTTSKRKRSNSLSSGYYKGPSCGVPPPSSLPPTARATPFREDGVVHSHHHHKHSLASSESSATDDFLYEDNLIGLVNGHADAATYTGSEMGDLTEATINGIHEDEEMECD